MEHTAWTHSQVAPNSLEVPETMPQLGGHAGLRATCRHKHTADSGLAPRCHELTTVPLPENNQASQNWSTWIAWEHLPGHSCCLMSTSTRTVSKETSRLQGGTFRPKGEALVSSSFLHIKAHGLLRPFSSGRWPQHLELLSSESGVSWSQVCSPTNLSALTLASERSSPCLPSRAMGYRGDKSRTFSPLIQLSHMLTVMLSRYPRQQVPLQLCPLC